jgi:hypothetical protein
MDLIIDRCVYVSALQGVMVANTLSKHCVHVLVVCSLHFGELRYALRTFVHNTVQSEFSNVGIMNTP